MLFKALAIAALSAVPVSGSGCYPTWSSGGSYSSGSMVSATVTTTTTSSSGTTTTTSTLKNFKCTSGSQPSLSHCPTYDPAGIHAGGAWSDQGACSGTATLTTPAPTTKPTPAAWTGKGCPNTWTDGASYEGGDLAEVDGVVYRCSTTQFVNAWCGNSNYKPGDSLYWEQAWTLLGSCTGTIAPTSSPVYVSISDFGGCPDEYATSTTYEAGDKVEKNGLVYQCRSWPNSAWCSMSGYEPDGINSKDAWTLLGYCAGTISPTKSPNFSALTDQNGCPTAFSASTTYEAGDKASVDINGVKSAVYECKSFPDSGYCNQYEPGHWSKLGWKLLGYCDGTIAPTKSPNFSALADQNGCPSAYTTGGDYEANDKVSVELTATHSVVYKCSGDVHQSRYCNQYEPGNEFKLGWNLIGYCDGTIAPTGSPNFSSLAETGSGCPKEYDVATTYEEGDRVSLVVSDTPDRAVVYECKGWPNGAYCNAGPNFAPDSANVNLGWTLKGYCDGTISPTISPSVYPLQKCKWFNGTTAVVINVWSASNLNSYVEGTRVRKHTRIYKCKGWPYALWCRTSGYEPEESANWNDAWVRAGDCMAWDQATNAPTTSPTKNPTKAPTKKPTKSPTQKPV